MAWPGSPGIIGSARGKSPERRDQRKEMENDVQRGAHGERHSRVVLGPQGSQHVDRRGKRRRHGNATRHGRSFREKREAKKAAERVYGVTKVQSELNVHLMTDDARSDADVRGDVLQALMLDTLVPATIDAKVNDGEVALTGEAEFQRDEAMQVAGNIRGVLTSGTRSRSSGLRRRRSTSRTRSRGPSTINSAKLDANVLTVETSQGTVTVVEGTVQSWAEHDEAIDAAWAAPGVREGAEELHPRPRSGGETNNRGARPDQRARRARRRRPDRPRQLTVGSTRRRGYALRRRVGADRRGRPSPTRAFPQAISGGADAGDSPARRCGHEHDGTRCSSPIVGRTTSKSSCSGSVFPGRLAFTVTDPRKRDDVRIAAAPTNALDVFNHPFAYAQAA